MKKVLFLVLASALAIFVAGCSLSSSSSAAEDKSSAPVESTASQTESVADSQQESAAPESAGAAKDGTLGDYKVSIDSARRVKDYEKKDAVAVTYTFTNNSDDAQSFLIAIRTEAYQNGVECERAILMDRSDKADNESKNIKKGATIQLEVAYEVADPAADLEIEVSESFSFSDEKISKTFAAADIAAE